MADLASDQIFAIYLNYMYYLLLLLSSSFAPSLISISLNIFVGLMNPMKIIIIIGRRRKKEEEDDVEQNRNSIYKTITHPNIRCRDIKDMRRRAIIHHRSDVRTAIAHSLSLSLSHMHSSYTQPTPTHPNRRER